MPGPFKPKYTIPNAVELNRRFLLQLFDRGLVPSLRDTLWGETDAQLRQRLQNELGINLPADVKIMLVDIQNARAKDFGINTATDRWYVWMLPPDPARSADREYIDAQVLEGAYHHAVVDGYGM